MHNGLTLIQPVSRSSDPIKWWQHANNSATPISQYLAGALACRYLVTAKRIKGTEPVAVTSFEGRPGGIRL